MNIGYYVFCLLVVVQCNYIYKYYHPMLVNKISGWVSEYDRITLFFTIILIIGSLFLLANDNDFWWSNSIIPLGNILLILFTIKRKKRDSNILEKK